MPQRPKGEEVRLLLAGEFALKKMVLLMVASLSFTRQQRSSFLSLLPG